VPDLLLALDPDSAPCQLPNEADPLALQPVFPFLLM